MIHPNDYQKFSTYLGSIYSLGASVVNSLDAIQDDLENTTVPSGKQPQATTIKYLVSSTAGDVQNEQVTLAGDIKATVVALQKLILTAYSSVDGFLSGNSVQVTPDFAALSNACGYPIDLSNVLS